ncbi:DUF397 domain-containing protein [Saccharopolyspora sp. K220]|uniref:DUF397 domain-containing protein n=1 Tax=Saccharopolyspora soli TaxID=2926618 RepID=UPI001F5A6424|nr:DUF397 domain-containing protein [Saccharopolyspora soli]MCI2421605.1 DUF397 domain-containing protein [Saccharopolyspora soli]
MSNLNWRKSSHSGSGANECVELAVGLTTTYIRDTKDRDGGTLCVSRSSWTSFLTSVKAGQLGR